jgi:hypothetical protein
MGCWSKPFRKNLPHEKRAPNTTPPHSDTSPIVRWDAVQRGAVVASWATEAARYLGWRRLCRDMPRRKGSVLVAVYQDGTRRPHAIAWPADSSAPMARVEELAEVKP